ncbi:hypothetical protein SAMN05216573_11257 [Bradyrhizobium sp. Rc3b]|uniref:hypothetical protein n=1 Tax=Bradyrhizobium sp. Rc3b TaxID=1855322 RepID=UPI0008EA27B4|nr:hypothetical protein [Bradyrhizobium sp. Rc3b]SFN37881.1 hypothetical protein SAMN05216573_11257 [Bradyrhizobium sp. Rc3b]
MVGVDYSAWDVQNGELRRRFDYQDSKTKRYIATIHLVCKIERGTSEPLTFLAFTFSPFRVVDGLDLGLSLAPLDGGRHAPVGVNVTSVEDGQGALMSPRTPQGLRLLLSHLLSGRQLKFGIFQGPEQLVDMPFYNDSEFAQLHQAQVAVLKTKASVFLAKITGVIPQGMNLPAPPVEMREFDNITTAKQWLLGEALTNLPTPVNNIEVFENGQSVWREWHSSHDALISKNELWWDAKDPGRKEREAADKERRCNIESGLIPHSQLSLKEQFEKANPRWLGPYFAWLPTSTLDAGTIWMTQYWVRASLGLKYKNKGWFPDND